MGSTTANELTADIEAKVHAGLLEPGQQLAPVRLLAAELGIAPNTVASAYRQLRQRGIVTGRGRQGTLVAHRGRLATPIDAAIPDGVVDARSGSPNPALQPSLQSALIAAAAMEPASYGDRIVSAQLAEAGARWLALDGVDATNMTLASGAMDAIERVLVEHLRHGDRVGVEDPGHGPVHDLVAALGLDPVLLPVDSEGVTPPGLAEALDRGVHAIIVTPRAHNPTGAAFTVERAADLDGLLRRHPNVLVIEDDHAGPVAGVALAPLDRRRLKWAVVRSVSKSLGPDLRLAFVVGDRDTIDRVEARLSIGPGWVSHLLQHTVAYLLDDPDTPRVIAHAADQYALRRDQLIDALSDAQVVAYGRSGLHVWIPVPAEQAVAERVRAAGFAIRLGAPYRRVSRPAVRVTIASLDNQQIDDVAAAIVAAVRPATATTRLS